MSKPSVEIGEPAPAFTLPGVENGVRRDYTLSEYLGRKVVLAFYPGDNTPGCTKQMCSYRDDFAMFEGVQATLLGISPQDVDSHEAWAKKRNLQFPLLADTDRAVAREYGVAAPVIGIRRSVFVIDAAGVLRYKDMKLIGATHVHADKLAGILAGV